MPCFWLDRWSVPYISGCFPNINQLLQNMSDAPKKGLFAKLGKTRRSLTQGLLGLFGGGTPLDDTWFDEIEDQLIVSDMGVEASLRVTDVLRQSARREKTATPEDLRRLLKDELLKILHSVEYDEFPVPAKSPLVILMVGVNGVGKTTTTAKLAHHFKQSGKQVMLAACDTFRAAAIEQLQRWGERLEVPVVAQQHGSDAAAVAHDAMLSARARGADVLIIDSAGRQHVNSDLMEQLGKVVRVLRRIDNSVPHESWLTIDAGNGQNVLSQIEHFSKVVPVTGLCVTKLDGTAKGGVMVAVAERFSLPVPFVGVGEGLDDLRRFNAADFVDALIDPEA